MLTVTKSLWATRQVMWILARVRIARSVLGNRVCTFGDIAFKAFSGLREVCFDHAAMSITTYGESRMIDDMPDVWERVMLGLPR
jgi:hypothetical protein